VQSATTVLAQALRLPPVFVRNLPESVARRIRWTSGAAQFESEPRLGLPFVSVDFAELPRKPDLEAALETVRTAMAPGGPADCLQALARLRAVSRKQPTMMTDERLAMAVYSEKLAQYPADAVAAAGEKWMEISPFWPSVSEILKMCEWAMQPRRELVRVLESALRDAPPVAGPSLRAVAGRAAHG
jgi:hypothetical protein